MFKTFYKNLNGDIWFLSFFIDSNKMSVFSGEVSVLPLLKEGQQVKDENGEYMVVFNFLSIYNLLGCFDDISVKIANFVADDHYVDFFETTKPEDYHSSIAFHTFHQGALEKRLEKEMNNINKKLKVVIRKGKTYA